LDENFQTYLNRVTQMTSSATYGAQVQHIQESPKYVPDGTGDLKAMPFPGYTVITPPGKDDVAENQPLFAALEHTQGQLVAQLGADFFAAVPATSFHMTLADLIWDDAYRHALETAGFEAKLRDRIAQIFQECAPMRQGKPIQFQAFGLMVMTRAIGVCFVPTDEFSYDRILNFRRALYQNSDLIGLGIEQQYYFTSHITLGYFGKSPTPEQRSHMVDIFTALNQPWLEQAPQLCHVFRAELRKFDDMTCYYREPDWTTFQF